MIAAQDILDRLDKVQTSGANNWMACCPAHPDKTPSLQITEKPNDLWIHCHAGCDQDSILEAVGFSWKDLPQKQDGYIPKKVERQLQTKDVGHYEWIKTIYEADRKQGKPAQPGDDKNYIEAVTRLARMG